MEHAAGRLKKTSNLLIPFLVVSIIFLSCYFVYYDEYTRNTTELLEANDTIGELTEGKLIQQSFLCSENKLYKFWLYLATYDRLNDCVLNVSLSDHDGIIQKWAVDCSQIKDNSYYPFLLDEPLNDSQGKNYTIEICSNGVPGNAITIYKNTASSQTDQKENGGILSEESICYYLEFDSPHLDTETLRIIIRFIIAILLTLLGWILLLHCKVKDKWVFLFLWCSLSILFSISLTLFYVPDEYNHFYRAFEISYGDMIADYRSDLHTAGYELPISSDLNVFMRSWQSFRENRHLEITPDNPTFCGFINTAAYAPISYLPQSIGIFFARCFTKNIAMIAYMGRFVNWLCITALLMMAIQIIPCGKKVLMLIALMPMNIHESISLAPDGMVVAVSAFMIAYILRCAQTPNTLLTIRDICILYALGICISLYKIVYLPFCLLFLLIPKEKFKNGMKGKMLHAIACCAIVLSLSFGWLIIAQQYLLVNGTSGQLQLQYILKDLLGFYIVLWRTFIHWGEWLLLTSVGSSLGWLTISTISAFTLMYLFAYVHSLNIGIAVRAKESAFRGRVFCCVIITTTILIAVSLYIQWTPLYNDVIEGLQGRYFLPLFLPAYFAFSKDRYGIDSTLHIGYQSVILITNLCAACCMLFACI